MTLRLFTTVASLLLAGAAHGQTPAASLPLLRLNYVSAFAGQPSAADPKPTDWVSSNALVGKLQGHAGHLRAPAGAAKP
jgi:hypothetical protein